MKLCIQGCEQFGRVCQNVLVAKVTLKIGPSESRFGGCLKLDFSLVQTAFSLSGEGDGVIVGFAKEGAVRSTNRV